MKSQANNPYPTATLRCAAPGHRPSVRDRSPLLRTSRQPPSPSSPRQSGRGRTAPHSRRRDMSAGIPDIRRRAECCARISPTDLLLCARQHGDRCAGEDRRSDLRGERVAASSGLGRSRGETRFAAMTRAHPLCELTPEELGYYEADAPVCDAPVAEVLSTDPPAGRANGSGRDTHPAAEAGEDVAVDFLERLRPGGPWVPIAIEPDRRPIITITAHTASEVRDFIRTHNGKRNLHYSVNPTRKALTKKAGKTDIAAIEFMLADLDPEPGETSEAGQRALSRAIGETAADGRHRLRQRVAGVMAIGKANRAA